MRLKYLFFPIILVICLALTWGYILPEYNEYKTVQTDLEDNLKKLNDANIRKNALEAIGSQIESDSQTETLINNYLPTTKTEEKIISNINFIASDAGVLLANLNIAPASDDPSGSLAASVAAAPVSATPAPGANAQLVQTSQATITANGEYSKLLIFFDKLEKMPIYNNIKSLKIAKPTKSSETDLNENPANLNAVIVVDFGYLKTVEPDAAKIAKLNQKLDTESIETIRSYVSSSRSVGENAQQSASGKTNPFLP
jgi:hypothetical protein